MKITLFTSNKKRHNYFINLLSEISDELFVVQECGTIFPGIINNHYIASKTMSNYFDKVNNAQNKIFGDGYIKGTKKRVNLLPILMGDLEKISLDELSPFLKSEVYIVFGSSFIKGDLIDFLVKKKAINIHMGVSPFYRGTDCNFWALYDKKPHLVGATIHMLSKGLDSGPILYHAMSKVFTNPFEYSMSTVKSAFISLVKKIKDNSIFSIDPIKQDKNKEIRYSTKKEFNDKVVKNYLQENKKFKLLTFDKSLLINPFFINKL